MGNQEIAREWGENINAPVSESDKSGCDLLIVSLPITVHVGDTRVFINRQWEEVDMMEGVDLDVEGKRLHYDAQLTNGTLDIGIIDGDRE
jgi:hypothetical protein